MQENHSLSISSFFIEKVFLLLEGRHNITAEDNIEYLLYHHHIHRVSHTHTLTQVSRKNVFHGKSNFLENF